MIDVRSSSKAEWKGCEKTYEIGTWDSLNESFKISQKKKFRYKLVKKENIKSQTKSVKIEASDDVFGRGCSGMTMQTCLLAEGRLEPSFKYLKFP